MSKQYNEKTIAKKSLSIIISVIVWLLIWEILSRIISVEFIFPGVLKTAKALWLLIFNSSFWKTVFYSMFRILLGFMLGVFTGIIISLLCQIFKSIRSFVSMGMTVIKSTPVASIIMVMWVIIGSAWLPALIALLMVAPIIWQNLTNGFDSVDKNLEEVCDIFEFSKLKRFRVLTLPALMKFFVPAVLTSMGLAWKSGIAAEIISYTKNSIGKSIFDAKNYFEGDVMFAWTITVIVISLIFEHLIRYLLRRFSQNVSIT